MARSARLVVPYCAHHIVHRGHNREPVFLSDADYRFYLDNLFALKKDLDCQVYAFCLMPNHVHLLVDPGANPDNLARLMKHLGGRQARYANRAQDRSGALWEGRFRSSPVSPDYAIPCCRYIELNPVRAYFADVPDTYEWSSYRTRLGLARNAIDHHQQYLALNEDASKRAEKYREYMLDSASPEEMKIIRDGIQRNGLTGDRSFKATIESELGIKIEVRRRGRPRKMNRTTGHVHDYSF